MDIHILQGNTTGGYEDHERVSCLYVCPSSGAGAWRVVPCGLCQSDSEDVQSTVLVST